MTRAGLISASIIVGAVFGGLVTSAVMKRGSEGTKTTTGHEKNEHAVLVLKDDNGTCKLGEKRPQEIYTESGSTVTWLIVGSCANAPEIAIDRNFHAGGAAKDIFTPDSVLKTTPQSPTTITGRLQGGLTPDGKTVAFKYTVLINGRPAEYASLADQGDLFACPSWPCS